jgi:hypothetical protein
MTITRFQTTALSALAALVVSALSISAAIGPVLPIA